MEFLAGGSVLDLIKPGPITEDQVATILRELLLALEYLHNDKKIHRDIKGFYSASFLLYPLSYPHHVIRPMVN